MSTSRRGRGSGPSTGRDRPGAGRGPAAPGRGRGGTGRSPRRTTGAGSGEASDGTSGRGAAGSRSAATSKSAAGKSGAGQGGTGQKRAGQDSVGQNPPTNASGSAGGPEPTNRAPRGRLTGRAAVLVLVLAALVVSYASSLRTWVEQRSEVAALQEENAERKAKVKAYGDQIERWKDPAYVEAQARTRFGWVKPGELGYVVVDENGRPVDGGDGPGASDGSGGGSDDAWWETLWGSVEKAGDPPKPKPTKEPKSEPADRIGPSGQSGSEDGEG